MITKKRCPFRRQDCTDECALYEEDIKQCTIKKIAGELFYIAEMVTQQPDQEDKA